MRVLCACEESQAVCIAFRERGHEAYSCDILPCSGGHPEWHIQGNVIPHLSDGWDLMIAHPPCTFLANSGARWLFEKIGRWQQLDEACTFFNTLLNAPIQRIAVENPMPHKWAKQKVGLYQQKIQPWYFGEKQKKTTCLWLKGLPPLMPTDIILPPKSGTEEAKKWESIWRMPPGPNQKSLRSKTFRGIANAIASQWGGLLT